MKIFALLSLVTFYSVSSFAVGNPLYTSLANVAAVGEYIKGNMSEIIDSSAELAKAQVPNSYYFLVTKKVEIDAENSTATLYMSSGSLDCIRKITSEVKADQWGENRQRTFSLSPTITCTQK